MQVDPLPELDATQGLEQLEVEEAAEEVPAFRAEQKKSKSGCCWRHFSSFSRHVGRVVRDVELGHRVEPAPPVLPWRPHPLHPFPQRPPGFVELCRPRAPLEDGPAPPVHHQAPGDQGDLVQGLPQQSGHER